VFSTLNAVPMLAPCWFRPAIRQLFRGGIEISHYTHQFLLADLFDSPKNAITGLRKLIWRGASVIEEPNDFRNRPAWPTARRELIVFQGAGCQFARLGQFQNLLVNSFREIVKPKWRRLADSFPDPVIGINVRRGKDFHDAKDPRDFYLKGGLRTPLAWFRESLSFIRKVLGFSADAVVVSDGSEADLAELLSMPNVRMLRPGCAVSDLLVLARTKVLIGSGGSSFSAWASFLGQMPTITIPGQSLSWFELAHANGGYVGELDPTHPSDVFVEQVERLRLLQS
jgi:hypothetical protein